MNNVCAKSHDIILKVKEILQHRIKEEAASKLSVSVYDTERNEKAKLHRQELVRHTLRFLYGVKMFPVDSCLILGVDDIFDM